MKSRIKAAFLSRDYRHYICYVISVGLLALCFAFPNSLPRLAETFRDFGLSFVYYVGEIISPGSNVVAPSVNAMPTWKWADEPWEPIKLFPYTWEEFQDAFSRYWTTFVAKETFIGYFDLVGDVLYYVARYGTILLPFVLALIIKLRSYTNCNPSKRKGKSKPLRVFEKFLFKVVYPSVAWIV